MGDHTANPSTTVQLLLRMLSVTISFLDLEMLSRVKPGFQPYVRKASNARSKTRLTRDMF